MKYTEGMIQALIWNRLHCQPLFCNVFTGCNEWDALYISAAGYATGFEIKLSKSDLKADFKKPRHNMLLTRTPKSGLRFGPNLGTLIKHFYYVCAGFSIDVEDIPEYAGLMIVNKYGLSVGKNAPILWKEKVDGKTINGLYTTLGKRYMYKKLEKHRSEYSKAQYEDRQQT